LTASFRYEKTLKGRLLDLLYCDTEREQMATKTVFYHCTYRKGGGFTFAIKIDDSLNYENIAKNFVFDSTDSVVKDVPIGFAKCHPKDQFTKEKGREIALTKMVPLSANLECVLFDYSLPNGSVNLTFNTVTPDGEKVGFNLMVTRRYTTVSFAYIKC